MGTLGLSRMSRTRLHVTFGGLSLGAYLVATVAFDFIARTMVTGESLGLAASKSVQWLSEPLGALWLLGPFVAATILSAELANASSTKIAGTFFGFLIAALGLLYFSGFWDAQVALREHKWTASALSIGMTPFLSIPILLVAAIASVVIVWRYRKHVA